MTLEVREICKRYGTLQAVDGVSFAAHGGRIFGVGILMTGKRFTLREILRWL